MSAYCVASWSDGGNCGAGARSCRKAGGGGRVLINEIMGSNLRTRETVALGEGEARNFYDIIEAQATYGWTTFDQSLHRAYAAGSITEETAQLYATSKPRMTRYLDDVKKQRGLADDAPTGLRLDGNAPAKPGPAPALKLGK